MGSKGQKGDFAQAPVPVDGERLLSKVEFQRLADVPPEAEWFANLTNENTKRAYRNDVSSFMRFVGIERPEDFRSVTRAHVIAWRKILEKRILAPATLRRKLSALSNLFDYLCEKNAVPDNRCMVWSVRRKVQIKEKPRPFQMPKRRRSLKPLPATRLKGNVIGHF